MSQEQQNTDDIAKNTDDIAQNTSDIKANLEELNEGGQERWQHIHASEKRIEVNDRRIAVLDSVKLRGVQFKINVLAAFVLVGLMFVAGLLQLQASHIKENLAQQCADAQVRAEVFNRNADLTKPGLTHVEVPLCPQ